MTEKKYYLPLVLLIGIFLPAFAFASVSGMDDVDPNIPTSTQQKLDEAITTYYQYPSVEKVETVLDIMNDSKLLRKKTAWPPMVGFLTVVFADNQEHLFRWMSRKDYNSHAQDVFVAALLHAKLKETALVFAQAHQWKKDQLDQLRDMQDNVDLKHLAIRVPGHIDTLWGAFFASGDRIYVDEIIAVLSQDHPPAATPDVAGASYNMPEENKKLAETTLRQYAPYHPPVREALKVRIAAEKDKVRKQLLKSILRSGMPREVK